MLSSTKAGSTIERDLHPRKADHNEKPVCIHPRVRGSTIASRHALGVETDVGASIEGLASDRPTASRETTRPHKTHELIHFGTAQGDAARIQQISLRCAIMSSRAVLIDDANILQMARTVLAQLLVNMHNIFNTLNAGNLSPPLLPDASKVSRCP